MGRYADPTFLSEDTAIATTAEFVAREAWIGRLVVALILLAMSAAPVWLGYEAIQDPPLSGLPLIVQIALYGIAAFIGLIVSLVGAVGGLAFFGSFLAALKPSNWVLRAGPHGLDVKLRNFADHRLPRGDAIVLRIPKREVRWIRAHDEKARHVGRSGDTVGHEDDTLVRQGYLEIQLHDDDLSAVKATLSNERRLWVPTPIKGVTQKGKGAPVSVRSNGILRIDWHTKGTRLRPNLAATLAYLATDYGTAPTLETEQPQAKTLDREAQESRLLDMVQQGNLIDAVIVAKGLYGFSTTEAKRYIEDLKA